jgi:nucleotide sugar dehydrogenase
MKLGIIGLGFVGSSVKNAYDNAGINTVCSDPLKGFNATHNELAATDAIFICVPSPQSANGSCDTSILESILEQYKDYTGVFISKVTASPLKYAQLKEQYPNLVHAPEFLVAATAKEDYLNGQFAIVGGDEEHCKKALVAIKLGQTKITNSKFCSIQEAALAKYTINSFLATKVIFMNQMKLLADKLNADYNVITECIQMDSRIGRSHMSVPGPDGKYGFGGACFPKDTSAINYLSKELGADFTLLEEVIRTNKLIRDL